MSYEYGNQYSPTWLIYLFVCLLIYTFEDRVVISSFFMSHTTYSNALWNKYLVKCIKFILCITLFLYLESLQL